MIKWLMVFWFIFSVGYGQTISVFTNQVTPTITANDGFNLTVGMKFQSTAAGSVVGVRFYKTSGMTGTHTGVLWDTLGTNLGNVVFTGETATGWQTANFPAGISISANTTYIISVFCSDGNYTYTNNSFGTAVTNSVLSGLANGFDGPNGVYIYGNSPAFPNQFCAGCKGSNYWVDLLFQSANSPIANAGPSQTIILPTSTATLNGTGSSGVISTYAWSTVSGPSVPNITSPTSATTTVTGLIAGVYTFQLSLNSGISTSTTNVTVSQPSNFTFTQSSSADVFSYGKGAEQWQHLPWNNTTGNGIEIPKGNTVVGYNLYVRFAWREIEDSLVQNTYNWSKLDAQFQNAINNNQMFSFGIMPICVGCSAGQIPTWLHTQMQGETNKDWWYPYSGVPGNGYWIPNWNDSFYLQGYKQMLQAVATHIANTSFNGVPYSKVLWRVDIRGFGNYGEWHSYPWYNYSGYPSYGHPTTATLDSLISYNLQIFPNYPNQILEAAYSGAGISGANEASAAAAYYAHTASNAWGRVGWRRDNWGDSTNDVLLSTNPNTYNTGLQIYHFDTAATNKWKYAPVSGEPLNGASSYSCGTPYCDLVREVNLYHPHGIGNGNWTNATDTNQQKNAITASALSGYRLVLDSGFMTTSLSPNTAFNITLYWQNLGVSPVYENWNVTYELRNATTVVWTGTSSFVPKLFLPSGTATSVSDNMTLGNVALGSSYNLYLIIRDPNGYKLPLFLAINGRNADGSYLLRSNIPVVASALCKNCLPGKIGFKPYFK